jgi:hypothetical protein
MSLRTASYSMSPELGKPHEVALHHPAIRRAVLESAGDLGARCLALAEGEF